MENSEHIVAWIESSAAHYDKLLGMERRNHPSARDGYISIQGSVHAATLLACEAYQDMVRTGDAHRDYTAADVLQAALALNAWRRDPDNYYLRGRKDYSAIRNVAADRWQIPQIVSDDEFYEMLGCVPPIYIPGVAGFLVGEALTSDERGTVYANYYEVSEGLKFARYHCVAYRPAYIQPPEIDGDLIVEVGKRIAKQIMGVNKAKARNGLIGVITKNGGVMGVETDVGFMSLEDESLFALKFRETFNSAALHDIGKCLYNVKGELCMEGVDQMRERLAQ